MDLIQRLKKKNNKPVNNYNKFYSANDMVDYLNSKYALYIKGNTIKILDINNGDIISLSTFKLIISNIEVFNETRKPFDIWIKNKNRIHINDIVFDPNKPKGYIPDDKIYNKFNGFLNPTVDESIYLNKEPFAETKQPFIEYDNLLFNICNYNRYLYSHFIKMLGYYIQCPDNNSDLMIIFRSKDINVNVLTIMKYYGYLFKDHYSKITSNVSYTSNVESLLSNDLLTFVIQPICGSKITSNIIEQSLYNDSINTNLILNINYKYKLPDYLNIDKCMIIDIQDYINDLIDINIKLLEKIDNQMIDNKGIEYLYHYLNTININSNRKINIFKPPKIWKKKYKK